ncbi:ankyrin repeat domain-containing protein [Paenibacillus polysaccharolyticus]|uniref:ankyrin repeat domain-containing protein n=1 Tax=Paenibacillus polysaccharolyticus TaxID=582692 RepID=UPI0020421C25|nr:ankyrin repeat domain-containing protein [Paenibacillus polysaccharolyticus]MCM3131219.1 ankyrin repeat domain-containing protein [Paenibacillus polysaccharolyticus]
MIDNQVIELVEMNDLNNLKKLILQGLDVNGTYYGSPYLDWAWSSFPEYNFEIVKLLIDNGANLNDKDFPSIVSAARHGKREDFEYIIDRGADINLVSHVGSSALSHAASWNNIDGVHALLELGIDVHTHGGMALRDAAYNGNLELVQLLLEKGADVNFNMRDQVHTDCATPLHVATLGNFEEVVIALINSGADPKIKNKYGERPFSVAKKNQNDNLIKLIKDNEPIEWHNHENKIEELKKKRLPLSIVNYLGQDRKYLELSGSNYIKFIELCSIEDVTEFKAKGIKMLNLVYDVDSYGAMGFIVWIPKYKALGSYDMEHDNLIVFKDVKWKEFIQDPKILADRVINGE